MTIRGARLVRYNVQDSADLFQGSWRVGDIPLNRLAGQGVKIDVSSKAQADPNYRVVKADILDHERLYGKISEDSIILIQTGQYKHYSNRTKYFGYPSGQVADNNVKDLHFPGLHPKATRWLIDNR